MKSLIFFSLSLLASFSAQSGDFTYTDLGTEIEITDYTGSETGHLVIPSSISGKPVTIIGDGAFGLSNFSALTIPNTVTHIKTFAFQGCTELLSLSIPSSVTQIDQGAFFENYHLSEVTFSGTDVQFGYGIFTRCGIGVPVAIDIPMVINFAEGMTSVGAGMFLNCRNIREITLPDSVETIGGEAFSGCAKLSTVNFGNGNVTTLNTGTFTGCREIKSIRLPDSLTTIGDNAFSSCTGLTSITIPASVDTVGETAFTSCTALKSALFLGDAPTTFDTGGFLEGAFTFADIDFKIYFLDTSSGFTSPTWEGYDTQELDVTTLPPAPWLVANELPLNADFSTSLNPQGVDLLTCYAFNLDPLTAETSDIANFTRSTGGFTLEFHGSSAGITYQAVTSTTLDTNDWSTTGVTLNAPTNNGLRTATIPDTAPRAFMRVEATQNW